MSDLKKIKDEFLPKLKGKLNLSEINKIKSELFGKNGLVSSQFKKIGSISESERKKFASDLNIVKDELQDLIDIKNILIMVIYIKEYYLFNIHANLLIQKLNYFVFDICTNL